MSRKAVFICISAIAVLLIVVAVAVAALYSGTGSAKAASIDDPRYSLIHAVPSDAVTVFRFSDLEKMTRMLADTTSAASYLVPASDGGFTSFLKALSAEASRKNLPLAGAEAVLSLHYVGTLTPLLVVDAGKSGDAPKAEASRLAAVADSLGLASEFTDCDNAVDRLSKKKLLLISVSESLLKSSQRHITKKISLAESDGFALAAESVSGNDLVFISCKDIKKLFDGMFAAKYRRYADFFSKVSSWAAFTVGYNGPDGFSLIGEAVSPDPDEDFMRVIAKTPVSASTISSVLPSYTLFAASLPFDKAGTYIDAYQQFLDAGGNLNKRLSARKELSGKVGISPTDWAAALDIKEAGTACFYAGKTLEHVILLKPGNQDAELIFKGTDITSLKDYTPALHPNLYAGYAASLFGQLFNIPDQSFFTYIRGWIVVGSEAAVQEYVSGRALENTLKEYMADAGVADKISENGRSFVSYFSFTQNPEAIASIFNNKYAASLTKSLEGITYEPIMISSGRSKSAVQVSIDLSRVTVRKSKAPVFERDTVISVAKGPFRVKNSGTGKMNLFYQQDNNYLCLQEEGGRGLWAAPFSTPIAGRAGTVDYFANGKLQILFASGSKLYLIDRLGRFVSPFPVDLGKNILLGPDIYDFNGTRRYNVMVLHDDNTIEMYNLQGKKPDQWKGITAQETIKNLPEELKVGGRTYWVVRTSIQTLIYPFYGGEPLTKAVGDKMIRPDSKIVAVSGGAVKAVCYDGKDREFKL